MIKVFSFSDADFETEFDKIVGRGESLQSGVEETVDAIIEDVRKRGG